MFGFPNNIFITRNELSDGSAEWFETHKALIDAAESEGKISDQVAVYQLVKVDRVAIRKTVEIVQSKKRP